eukprot:GFUD01112906.1.p1 GENE.GFUD01112906.1~~GFUD01112906.1.p1  ORF type:complete len:129 (-),score=28.59 GFUD01112906.1:70-456(-)
MSFCLTRRLSPYPSASSATGTWWCWSLNGVFNHELKTTPALTPVLVTTPAHSLGISSIIQKEISRLSQGIEQRQTKNFGVAQHTLKQPRMSLFSEEEFYRGKPNSERLFDEVIEEASGSEEDIFSQED